MKSVSEKRIGVIAILVEEERQSASRVNEILSQYGQCILARMGVPNAKEDLSVISVVVELTTEDLGALTGRLGNLKGSHG